jgi:hypothetical protein
VSAGVCFVGLRFIGAQYSPSRDAIQADLLNCNETGRHCLKKTSSPSGNGAGFKRWRIAPDWSRRVYENDCLGAS